MHQENSRFHRNRGNASRMYHNTYNDRFQQTKRKRESDYNEPEVSRKKLNTEQIAPLVESVENNHVNERKVYSANNRLKVIREGINPTNKETNVATVRNYVDNSITSTNQNVIYQKNSNLKIQEEINHNYSVVNQKNSLVVTAKPSTLSKRLDAIRNPCNNNDSNTHKPVLSTVGGGWFKSVDIERNVEKRDENKTAEKVTPTSLSGNNDINKLPDLPGSSSQIPATMQGSVNNSNVGKDETEMDWSYFEDKETLTTLEEFRKTGDYINPEPQTPFQQNIAKSLPQIKKNETIFKIIFIVVDTNIFLSHLDVVKQVMKIKINGLPSVVRPKIFIPWIVIQELDYIKDGRCKSNLKSKAKMAIKFINDCLCKKLNLIGQSVRDASEQDFTSNCFDDGILFSCLQIRDRRNRAVLLSNDVNLRNKLLSEGFEAFSHDQIVKRLDPFNENWEKTKTVVAQSDYNFSAVEDGRVKMIRTYMSHLFSFIILKELKDLYGDKWSVKNRGLSKPPWSLEDCLASFVKYWMPIFHLKLHNTVLHSIQNFKRFLREKDKPTDVEKLLDMGLAVCVFFQNGLESYKVHIQECIKNMKSVYDNDIIEN